MYNMKWKTGYDRFLSLGSWINAFLQGVPAAVLLAAMYIMDVSSEWWTPVILIYAIGAVAFSINFGFMAVNIQMKTIADHWQKDRPL